MGLRPAQYSAPMPPAPPGAPPGPGVQRVGMGLIGQTEKGNINLHTRPTVHNADGTISTVRSITVTDDNGAVLIPTVVGNKVVSNSAAIKHYQQTGEHLGRFVNEASADRYAQSLHEGQAREYGPSALVDRYVAQRPYPPRWT